MTDRLTEQLIHKSLILILDAKHAAAEPIHVEYVMHQKRLESFKNWPEDMTQKPFDLAEAGFVSDGKYVTFCMNIIFLICFNTLLFIIYITHI